MNESAPLCFIDTETDGVHPDRRAWEVAMIRRDGDDEKSIQFFVEIDLSSANQTGLKIGGFYERHPLGLTISGHNLIPPITSTYDQADHPVVVPVDEAALIVAQFTHGAHLVGAVPNFDAEVLAQMMRTNGMVPSWHYHLIDVEALMIGWLAGRSDGKHNFVGADGNIITVAPPWTSDALSLAIGVTLPDERHTAMGDARWAQRCYDFVMGNVDFPSKKKDGGSNG